MFRLNSGKSRSKKVYQSYARTLKKYRKKTGRGRKTYAILR